MLVTEIQRFSTKDGPGLRTVVFLKGCPLDCVWCHNPETKSAKNQVYYSKDFCIGCRACILCPNGCHMFDENRHEFRRENCAGCMRCAEACPSGALSPCAREMTADEIVSAVLRDRAFWGEKGGVTLSGGEPLIHPEAAEILRGIKKSGGTTAVETCGHVPREILESVLPVTDLFFWDMKAGDREKHRELTGVYPDKIRENLLYADSMGASTAVRCIVAKGLNDDEDSFRKIGEFCAKLKNMKYLELLKYHAMGGGKEKNLTGKDTTDRRLIPSEEDMDRIKGLLQREFALNVK